MGKTLDQIVRGFAKTAVAGVVAIAIAAAMYSCATTGTEKAANPQQTKVSQENYEKNAEEKSEHEQSGSYGCKYDEECFERYHHQFPRCTEQGGCVACIEHEDCYTVYEMPFCDNGECVECFEDKNCDYDERYRKMCDHMEQGLCLSNQCYCEPCGEECREFDI